MATPNPPPSNGAPRRTSALYNWVSTLGLVLIVIGIIGGLMMVLSDALLPAVPAYLGLMYVPLLMLIVAGVVMYPLGYALARRKQARGEALRLPLRIQIDFTLPRHRNIFLATLAVGIVSLAVAVIGSFQAYQAMETNTFCGQMCHSVMGPEYTAYQHTPHARVKCVECHIGSGVGWYIHSKTSGMRRLAALLTNSYARPIPTPIQDMRPARETCEECHWSSRFVGYKEKVLTYYTSEETSPEIKMRMLLKIGGADSPFMKGFGIHYHMQVANKVEYISKDRQRQEISWVRVSRADGRVTEYNNEEAALTDPEKKTLPVRRMECLDCHNRPAHDFKSPMHAVDEALAAGTLNRALPFIKVQAVKALDGKYATEADARAGIRKSLTEFYKAKRPEVLEKQGALVNQTVTALQTIYATSFFPEMKVKWSAYPNNLGHRDWPGCFRCHNDKMVSAKGEKVFTDCTKCHLILAQGDGAERGASVNFSRGQAFTHPGTGEVMKEYAKCTECHAGGAELY
jgi:nitrate/TMAO reductase-like tetraheme cytochrome c subunit